MLGNKDPDILLRAGFQAVTHSLNFHTATLKKGQDLVKSCHVKRVEELQSGKLGHILIRASVVRTTSVTLTPYKVSLELISFRLVIKNKYFKSVIEIQC